MAALTDISDILGVAKAYVISKLPKELAKLKIGLPADVDRIVNIEALIMGLTFQIQAQVNDLTTTKLYMCLLNQIAGATGTYILDPEVVIPGKTTVVITSEWIKIPAGTPMSNGYTVTDYQTYYQVFGNSPDIDVWQDDGTGQFIIRTDIQPAPLYVGGLLSSVTITDATDDSGNSLYDLQVRFRGVGTIVGPSSGGGGGSHDAIYVSDSTLTEYTQSQLNTFYPVDPYFVGAVIYCQNINLMYTRLSAVLWSVAPLTIVE